MRNEFTQFKTYLQFVSLKRTNIRNKYPNRGFS